MKKLTTEIFIERARCLLGDNYDFSKTKYINSHTKVIITCKIHGDFLAYPTNILAKSCGCPICKNEKISKSKFLPQEEFIRKAKRKHGNWYDYSLVDYKDSQTKVKIICPAHGVFEQTPNNHLKGCGCPECAKLKFSSN